MKKGKYINEFGNPVIVLDDTMDHVLVKGGPNGSYHLHKGRFLSMHKPV